MTPNSCLIIAGEKSGEEHAMTFLNQLMKENPDLHFYGVGGDEMKSLGVELYYHLRDFSTMGFSAVVSKIPFYFKAMNNLISEVDKRKTKFAILVDYQDFNLRMAKKLSKKGVVIFYYVAPQAWGWRPGRAQVLSKIVHTLFCLLPFEREWFRARGVKQAVSVDHPVFVRFKNELEKVKAKNWDEMVTRSRRLLILPGSRYSEIRNHLPLLRDVILKLKVKDPLIEVGMVKVQHLECDLYQSIDELVDYEWMDNDLSKALDWGDICFAASGTVTLTCGLFAIPTVVFYQGSLLNEFILFNLIRYKGYISLTNLVLGEKIFPEWVQSQFTSSRIVYEYERIMKRDVYNKIAKRLLDVRHLLRGEVKEVGLFIDHEFKKIYEKN